MEDYTAFQSIVSTSVLLKHGWFFQQMHKQGVHLLIIISISLLFFQFKRVSFTKKEYLAWVLALLVIVIMLFSTFSGNILVGDGFAKQSYQIGGNFIREIPLIGYFVHLVFYVSDAPELHTNSLMRFYILHILVLPAVLIILLRLKRSIQIKETFSTIENSLIILGSLLFQTILSFALPLKDRTNPYTPDWFFYPINFLQYEFPISIVGLFLGLVLIILLSLPRMIRKK